MISLCLSCCHREKAIPKPLPIAILGLDNAGKTVMSTGLTGEKEENPAPTVGFNPKDLKIGRQNIRLMDIGGGKRVRNIWKNYLAEIYGVVYVIDATDSDRMKECRQVLNDLLKDPRVRGKPILILANKQDKKGAMDEMDICDYLHLETLVNSVKCPSRIELCSAISYGNGKKVDPAIYKGFCWLIGSIQSRWEELDSRIKREFEEHKEEQKRKFNEKKLRADKQRAIRDEEENENRKETIEEDEIDSNRVGSRGDPFKPLSKYNNKREILQDSDNNDDLDNDDYDHDKKNRYRSNSPPILNKSKGLPSVTRTIIPPRQLEPIAGLDYQDENVSSLKSRKKKKKFLKSRKVKQISDEEDEIDYTPRPKEFTYDKYNKRRSRSRSPSLDEKDEYKQRWSLELPERSEISETRGYNINRKQNYYGDDDVYT